MIQDVVIVGGGVIGLSAALELTRRGATVRLLEKTQVGREASWAGAGMLPPGQIEGPVELRQLMRYSASLWPELAERLLAQTGIDNGYRRSGSLQVSTSDEQQLSQHQAAWEGEGVPTLTLEGDALREYAPGLSSRLHSGFALPTMAQVRNPRHLQALRAALENMGALIQEETFVDEILRENNRIIAVKSGAEIYRADCFLIATGAWTSPLLKTVGVDFPVEPVRGQIVLLETEPGTLTHIIEDGKRYLVPRDDGLILVGSTLEQVGFLKETTAEATAGLIDFAASLMPELRDANVIHTWAGLRPRAVRGVPAIGRVTPFENLYLAAGHFRDGLMQSSATAMLISDLIQGIEPQLKMDLFSPPAAR